jgi:EAL and modified HD-GYP domain-containing signal transduction protein
VDVFIARQPIFDIRKNVYAYELLYRAGERNASDVIDGEMATSSVIASTLMLLGLDAITQNKLAFINFTKQLIQEEIPTIFSNEKLVVEILEDVIPDDGFIEACLELKGKGYRLALDDFVIDYPYQKIIDLVDIIKVDFLLTSPHERQQIIQKYKDRNIVFLAEKVETLEQFEEAVKSGYTYFQGYFFAKPIVVKHSDIKPVLPNYAKILTELSAEEPNYERISEIIEFDVSLSYKLLRLINSAAFYSNSRVTSIKHALVMLGLKEIRKWISIVMLRELGEDKPDELVRVCLLRGKMGEQLAEHFGLKARRTEVFLMGMFSMIDTLMNQNLEEAISSLPLEDDVKSGILGEESVFSDILNLVKAYEKGNWDYLFLQAKKSGVGMNVFPDAYLEAVKWATEVY